ncbi:MAG: Gfo/Idh/MocA family oxidoreductase [Planctomycetota bacterium]
MHILARQWQDGYLDYHRPAGEARIAVRAWWPLERLHDVQVDQPRRLARLWHYYREVGLRELTRKVRSRLRETLRDRRFFCIGLGEVLETDADTVPAVGSLVAFITPSHPECVERVCLPVTFTTAVTDEVWRQATQSGGVCLYRGEPPSDHPDWDNLAGWSRFSGTDVDHEVTRLLPWVREIWRGVDLKSAEVLAIASPAAPQERHGSRRTSRGALSGVVFGLGNYAKTCILPNIDPRIDIQCIHEIEPPQLGRWPDDGRDYDAAEFVRPDEHYDVFFIAGYHHTHADLAVAAMRGGGWAVMEKPLVTTRGELDRLLAALREHPGRVYAGFHMRHNPLWPLAREDLQLAPGQPVNYHCIVYEIPYPRRHWYNWPNARSRIVSNGCHWLDHFLFMNGYPAVERCDLWLGRNHNMQVNVELANGATLSMSLTDHGSRRIGVQEHVQLRAGGVTVRVDNAGRYMSEDRYRIIRRQRINKMISFHHMYRTITQRIIAGQPGDSLESVQRTCELMLALDEMHAAQSGRQEEAES